MQKTAKNDFNILGKDNLSDKDKGVNHDFTRDKIMDNTGSSIFPDKAQDGYFVPEIVQSK